MTLRTRLTLLASIAVCVAIAAAALVVHGQRASADPQFVDAASGTGFEPCSAPIDHYAASASPVFHGLQRGPRIHRCAQPPPADVGPPVPTDISEVSYGDCHAAPGQACSPPLTVQSWPACERNLSLYDRYPGPPGADPIQHTDLTIRGVPAASFNDGEWVEVYTGDTTVVIFGQTQQLEEAAAQALVGTDNGTPVSAAAKLPDPQPGATAGQLSC
jgi:class 3 adenylate cyclase